MVCTRQAWYLLSPGSVSFILILDLRMPKKDGLEVVAELMSQRPRPPIIVFTNSEKAADLWRALTAGAKGYHAKPTVISDNLRCNPPNLVLEVTDNGSGIADSQAASREGIGFSNMRARAENIGAQLEVRSAAAG